MNLPDQHEISSVMDSLRTAQKLFALLLKGFETKVNEFGAGDATSLPALVKGSDDVCRCFWKITEHKAKIDAYFKSIDKGLDEFDLQLDDARAEIMRRLAGLRSAQQG